MGKESRVQWETSGGQVGDKCEIMRAGAFRASRVYLETSARQIQSVVGDKWGTSGDKCEIMRTRQCRVFGRKTNPETKVKSCGPSMHPFQRSKNPSQVNLFGEKIATET